jgi:TPR repeat protein
MAVKWYREAANKNDILAMRSLHSLHEYGSTSGVDVDKVESAKWCLKAAELGVPSLQHIMAIKYQSGEGVPIDTKAAIFWCRESAERGYSNAQYDLAQKYYKGEGVPQDFVLAYKWFNIATGDTDSPLLSTCKHYRDLVSKDMTKEQIAEGQKMSRDWNKKGSW